MAVKMDLSGEQFGDLTVIGIAEDIPGKKKKGSKAWLEKRK